MRQVLTLRALARVVVIATLLVVLGLGLVIWLAPRGSTTRLEPVRHGTKTSYVGVSNPGSRIKYLGLTLGTAALGVGLLGVAFEVMSTGALTTLRSTQEDEAFARAGTAVLQGVVGSPEFAKQVEQSLTGFAIKREILKHLGDVDDTSANHLADQFVRKLQVDELRRDYTIDLHVEEATGRSVLKLDYKTTLRPNGRLRLILRIYKNPRDIDPTAADDEWVYTYILPPGVDFRAALQHFQLTSFAINDTEYAALPDLEVHRHGAWMEASYDVELQEPTAQRTHHRLKFSIVLPSPLVGHYSYFKPGRYTHGAKFTCRFKEDAAFRVRVIDLLHAYEVTTLDERSGTDRVRGVETSGWVGPDAAVVFSVFGEGGLSTPPVTAEPT